MLNIGDFARLAQISPRMLRHYDELGLLRPEHVDAATGYRSYSVRQLERLQRLVALRDLGFSLEQIKPLLDDKPKIERLRGMLELRRAQIEDALKDDRERLQRVEAYLIALEKGNAVSKPNVVVKKTQPLRIAESTGVAKALDSSQIGPVFQRIVPEILAHLARAKVRPMMMVGYYDAPFDDGSVVVHVAFEIGSQSVPLNDSIHVTELPVVEVASVVHRGAMRELGGVYVALLQWIEDSGSKIAGYGRELYLEMSESGGPSTVEIQVPIAR